MDKVISEHQARYKNSGLNSRELRRRREEDSVQLRKQKRDDVLSKRRTLNSIEDEQEMNSEMLLNNSSGQMDNHGNFINSCEGHDLYLYITKDVLEALRQDDNEDALMASAQKVRKILSKEPQPPFDEVIQSGLLPRLVGLLDRYDNSTIQFEVAWILTNVCSGTSQQTRTVVDHGAVPRLVELLDSSDLRVCEQAVWALGNIVGDCAELRDIVIRQNFLPKLYRLIRPDMDVGFLRNVAWVLVNVCRNKDPPPPMDIISELIPYLRTLINSTDLTILTDSSWAVSYITEHGSKYSQLVIDNGLLHDMTKLLSHDDVKIKTAAIRALGSIVTGDDEHTQAVIDAGALPHLYRLINVDRVDKLVKEALWFLSNIAAGSVTQIQQVIDHHLIERIIYHMNEGDPTAKKEAAWAIYNMSLSGTPEQLEYIIEQDVIPALCDLLKISDQVIVRNVLDTLTSLLKNCHDRIPDLCEKIEECGGLDLIEQLQTSPNPEIYEFAYTIIDQYFNEQESL